MLFLIMTIIYAISNGNLIQHHNTTTTTTHFSSISETIFINNDDAAAVFPLKIIRHSANHTIVEFFIKPEYNINEVGLNNVTFVTFADPISMYHILPLVKRYIINSISFVLPYPKNKKKNILF